MKKGTPWDLIIGGLLGRGGTNPTKVGHHTRAADSDPQRVWPPEKGKTNTDPTVGKTGDFFLS